jgi:hypothetical protein
MAQHEALSVGILTSSLCLIAFLALVIVGSNKDKNDRYDAQSSVMRNTGEGRSTTRRRKKHRISKSKSLKQK